MSELTDRISSSATYKDIKDYIEDNYGIKVSSLYIAQMKDKYGIKERQNYNLGTDGHKVPICPYEKEKAIVEAFKYFNLID